MNIFIHIRAFRSQDTPMLLHFCTWSIPPFSITVENFMDRRHLYNMSCLVLNNVTLQGLSVSFGSQANKWIFLQKKSALAFSWKLYHKVKCRKNVDLCSATDISSSLLEFPLVPDHLWDSQEFQNVELLLLPQSWNILSGMGIYIRQLDRWRDLFLWSLCDCVNFSQHWPPIKVTIR